MAVNKITAITQFKAISKNTTVIVTINEIKINIKVGLCFLIYESALAFAILQQLHTHQHLQGITERVG